MPIVSANRHLPLSKAREKHMTAAQFELLDVDQATAVLQWRFQKLIDAGHEMTRALLMAAKPEVDISLASALLSAACETRAC
jgi:hypothetical protein